MREGNCSDHTGLSDDELYMAMRRPPGPGRPGP